MAIFVKKDDRRPHAAATLKDALGVAVNVSGMTVKFIMTPVGGTVPKVNAAAAIVDGPNGKVEYAWLVGDTDTAGNYKGEFEVTDAAGKKMTFPNDGYIDVSVVADLG